MGGVGGEAEGVGRGETRDRMVYEGNVASLIGQVFGFAYRTMALSVSFPQIERYAYSLLAFSLYSQGTEHFSTSKLGPCCSVLRADVENVFLELASYLAVGTCTSN